MQRSNKNFKFLVAYKTHSNSICLVVIIIYCDNMKAQALVKNLTQHARNKHINIQQHFVKNKVIIDDFNLQHVFNDQQIIDDLINFLIKNKFLKFRRELNLQWLKLVAKLSQYFLLFNLWKFLLLFLYQNQIIFCITQYF